MARVRSYLICWMLLSSSSLLHAQGWFQQASGTSHQFYGVSFASASHGTAVGVSGTIRRTTNGGTNWTGQSSGTSVTLYEVDFVDPATGWVVGGSGTILKTTSGGTNWVVQSSGTSSSLTCVDFINSTVGTIVGENGVIRRTTNGGSSWSAQSSGTTNNLWGVYFVDANTGLAVGENGKILRTTNGGTTWAAQSSGTTSDLWEVSMTSATTAYVVGNGGTILRTIDGGTTWSSQSSGTGVPLYHAFFRTANKGTIVGGSGTILQTTNAGLTWTGQSSGVSQPLHEVVFTDENTGTAVGVSGTILRTTSGGVTCPVITISPSTLPSAVIGESYSASLTASGGVPPFAFSLTSGLLPPGLTLSASGLISGTPTTTGTYAFTVSVADDNNCQGIRTYSVQVQCTPLMIAPDTLSNGSVAIPYSRMLTATGGVAPYSFAIVSGTLPSGVTLSSAGLISGSPVQAGQTACTIAVTDAAGCTGTKAYTLLVECPSISINPGSLPSGNSGIVYSQTLSAAGGVAPYSYAITSGSVPPGLGLTSGGVLGGTPTTPGSYSFGVTTTDAGGCTGTGQFSIVISCPALVLSPVALPAGAVGISYNETITSTGGMAPYQYAISSGSIPTGLSLSGSGMLSGTPTAAGSFTFTILATDAQSCTGSRGYTVQVACPSIQILPAGLAAGTAGSAYSAGLTASGGTGPYSFALTAGSLPSGLTLASTGGISGVPAASGSSNFTVTVTDGQGCTGATNYTLVVNCPVIGISPSSLPGGSSGTPYSVSLLASGGSGPYQFVVSSGVLPVGLTLTGSGLLAGTPGSYGTFPLAVTSTDAQGCEGTQSYSLTIACPTISLSSIDDGVVGTPFSQTITATGGTGPYAFALTSGSLPAGLSLSGQGTLTGTPSLAGSSTFTVTATDAMGCTGMRTFTHVMTCPSIGLSSLTGGTVGVAYSSSVVASGGNGPYAYALSGGLLPPGLTLTESGLLSGTPTSGGNFTFTISATDAFGCTGSTGYTISMACTPILLAPPALQNGSVGVVYDGSISASGGTGPYLYALSSGSLPPGLSLSSAGLISGMPTSNGTFNFSVTATDLYGCTGTRSYSIDVSSCPTIAIAPASLPSGSAGTGYSETLSSAGGVAPYAYTLSLGALPPGVSMNSSGLISGTPSSGGSYDFTISTTDAAGCVGHQSYRLVVCGAVTLSSLAAGTTGTYYSQAIGSSGGTAPLSYSLTSGSLPPGLSFSSSGLIAGMPASAGTFAFTIEVVDANGCTGLRAYALVIDCPPITLNPTLLAPAVSGISYSESLSATGGTAPYVYTLSSGALPSGLTLSSSGHLSGLAGATGASNFTVQVTDASGCQTGRSYVLNVECGLLQVLPAVLPSALVGSSYAAVLSAAGGSAPYLFTVTSGSMPPGLSVTPSGVVSGTPTASGTYAFTIGLQDVWGCSSGRNYSVQVDCPALSLNPPSLPSGATGSSYSQTLTAVGGTAPHAFSVTAGSLPAGIVLSTGGVLSGIPSTPGSFSFSVTVVDARGCDVTAPFTLAIACPVVHPVPSSLGAGQAGMPYSQTMSASGGSPPYSFVISSGSLPAGVTLSSSGILSGVPATVGTFNIQITATDGGGCSGSSPYELAINCPPIVVAPTDLPAGTAGTLYGQQLTPSGGAEPYGYTLSSGTLPPGLALSPSGLISGSPTASGAFSFGILVTDGQGCTVVKPYAMVVGCPQITILPGSIPGGVVGSPYSAMLGGSGGTGPYTFVLLSGSLPAGLSLASGGVISGLPSGAAVAAFVVGVTDANGCQGIQPFTLSVVIAPVCVIEPDSLFFGGVLVGESRVDTVRVSNTGSGPLTVYSASSTSGHFTVWPLQTIVPAGSTQPFVITFTPGSSGLKAGNVLFTHNAPTSPESLHVEGMGTAPVFSVFTMISFGQVHIGSAKVDSVKIVNTGSTTLTISSVVTDHAEFSVFPGAATLAPGAGQVFLVVFVPGSIGTKEGNLIFTHNATGSPAIIPFSGAGIVNVIVRKLRDADGDNQTVGDRFPKRWQLSLYRSEVLPANLVASVDSSELVVPLMDAGTYIAVESDSGGGWSRVNGNLTFNDTLLVDGTVAVADTFVNFRRNTITVRQLEDLDGVFASPGDRATKPWHLELRRDSIGGPIIASGNSGSLVVSNLGDGIYCAVHADSAGWRTIGSVRDGLPVSDSAAAVIIHLTEGASPQIDFINSRAEYFYSFRSFTPEELGQKVATKKKAHAVRFCAQFVNTVGGNVDGLDITFYSTGLTSNVTTMESYGPFTSASSYNGKLWHFGGAWIANGETVTVCAVANKNKTVAVASWNWTVNGLPLDKQAAFKPASQYRLLPMPNFANVRNEMYAVGSFAPTNGMIIGVPSPESPKSRGWVRLRTARALQRSMVDRGVLHSAVNHGFDRFASGKPMVKEQKELIPRKHNNKLFAEAVALRAGIYASAVGMSPPGFGELIYDESPANALCGLTLAEISHRVDSALSLWDTPSFLGWDYPLFTGVVEKINRAFEGAVDTLGWSDGLILKGVRQLVEVPFLHPNPTAVPFRIDRAAVAGLQPKAFELYQNYPNPFNPTTTIEFDLTEAGFVTLRLYNVLGQEVATLLDREEFEPGRNDVELNASDLSSGVYFYRVTVESIREEGDVGEVRHVDTRKMMLVK